MILRQLLPLIVAALLLNACAVAPLPEPPALHPASPAAAEAPSRPAGSSLSADEATRTTDRLLSQPSAGSSGMSR